MSHKRLQTANRSQSAAGRYKATSLFARVHRRRGPVLSLQMAPLIDVVFLLLVFFLLTANFRSQEGFLPAELPRETAAAVDQMELEPLEILIDTLADGRCRIYIGTARALTLSGEGEEAGPDFGIFGEAVLAVLAEQGRHLDDPVKLSPTPKVTWNHLVKAYDALWEVQVRRIVFVLAE